MKQFTVGPQNTREPTQVYLTYHWSPSIPTTSIPSLIQLTNMAESHSPAPGLPTPSPSATRRSTAPAAPKLRDSCHACASSKLKCYKEKPTCSRCAKRGLTCEYVATKRGGRKHENRLSSCNGSNTPPINTATNNVSQPLPPLSSWFGPSSSSSSTDALPSPGAMQSSPIPTTTGPSSNLFPNFLSSMEQPMITDLDDFLTSPTSFSVPDMCDTDFLGQSQLFSTDLDSSSNSSATLFDTFPVFEDAVSELFALSNSRSPAKTLSNPRSPPNSRASPISEAQSYQGSRAIDSSCFCLVRALGLMKQFSHHPSTTCTNSPAQSPGKTSPLTSIQTVIAKNENTIEAVSTMLHCSCSQDGYLLAIMSLIIFKMLGCYAAAARKKPSFNDDNHSTQCPPTPISRNSSHSEIAHQDPTAINRYCRESEDSTRMSGQLILSELHRVQRLVNQLSAKLKVQAAKGGGMADALSNSAYENADTETTLPLSALMLDQLEVDLRRRLRGVSMTIVEGLRGR